MYLLKVVDILALDDQTVSGGYGNKGASDPEDQLRLLEKQLTKTTGSNLGNKSKNTTFATSLSTILII